MDNSTFKSKSHKNVNDVDSSNNFQYHIRPKPRTKRKSKTNSSSVDLQQTRGGLYSAISESSMCYPIPSLPPAIPIEHHPSVSFLPIYQPSCCTSYQCCHQKPQPPIPTRKVQSSMRDSNKYLNTLNANDSFTSLPPAIASNDENSPTRRRFSDPGFANDDVSITSDETRDIDDNDESAADFTSMDFEEELIILKKDYVKLNRELSKTKKELNLLKSIVQNQNVHSPILITDLIKEVQSAADIREEAFISRIESLIDQSQNKLAQINNGECASCKNVLSRLETIENQIKELSFNTKPKSSSDFFSNLNHEISNNNGIGIKHTGYASSNGLNPFTYEEDSSSSRSPSTDL